MAMRDLPAITDGLRRYLSETWGRPIAIENLIETSAGARRGNLLFDAVDGDERIGLVLTIYPPPDTVIFGVQTETEALRLVEKAGAPVAHVHELSDDTSWFGEPFFISSRIEGETVPRRILRQIGDDRELGERIGAQLGRAFASIHSVPATDAPEELRPPDGRPPAERALAGIDEQLSALPQPSPSWRLAMRWLEKNLPAPPPRETLIHSDVRNGNIVVSTEGLEAILDWEGCHTGDPHQDLAWPCVRTWRFGIDHLELGGFSSRQAMIDAYVGAGAHYDPASFEWWKVLSTLRWGAGLSKQAMQHLDGSYRSIVMAVSGRRACEQEYDLLRLLAGHLG
ncbi:MAG: phosphotransferase family protein [Actinomycetota bacterium]|nr:phosphotransferase family protein [Actinomycetota bacterium]